MVKSSFTIDETTYKYYFGTCISSCSGISTKTTTSTIYGNTYTIYITCCTSNYCNTDGTASLLTSPGFFLTFNSRNSPF